jgi:hypothetical protein
MNNLDCKICYTKKTAKTRTGSFCNNCGVDLGIGPHLLRTTKQWMVRTGYSCTKCIAKRKSETWRCIIEGSDDWQRTGGYCLTHVMQAQRDKILLQKRSSRCVEEGCNKQPQCGGHCVAHATQAQRDKKICVEEGWDKLRQAYCGVHCAAHATQAQRDERKNAGCVAHATQAQRDKKTVLKMAAISSDRHTAVYIVLPMPRKRRGTKEITLGKNVQKRNNKQNGEQRLFKHMGLESHPDG